MTHTKRWKLWCVNCYWMKIPSTSLNFLLPLSTGTDPQMISEHDVGAPQRVGWLDDLLAFRLMMVIVTLICQQTRAFNCPYTTAKSSQFGGNSTNSNCLLWLMWLHKWNPVKVRCVDLSLADFPFFRLFQGTFPHEVSATSEKSQGFPWFGSQMFFDTSELHGFDTHKYLQPIDESMYTHHMRIEHGESKCSQNERHIWNLSKCFSFCFGHSETWVHQTFTSLCCVLWPRGFPRGPTRRDAAQALALGEVMQVDRGRWRLKTQNCRKVMMIDAHGFVSVPFKTTRCQNSLRRWNQNEMVNICRVTQQRWWNYSEFQSWNGWHRTLVSAQLHITYLRFQAWLQPNLHRSNQHVTWTFPPDNLFHWKIGS